MITFKQFLTEKTYVAKTWDIKTVEVDRAIDFLNTHCKNGLKAIANNGLLYRGFQVGSGGNSGAKGLPGEKFSIVDSSTGLRTSRDSSNAYQLMMDSSAAMQGVPSRSRSFICSTDKGTADSYGSPFVMVPIDGLKVAVSKVDDVLQMSVKSQIANFGSMSDLSDAYSGMFDNVNAPKKQNKFVDAAAVNAAMAAFTPEELTLLIASDAIQYDGSDPKIERAFEKCSSIWGRKLSGPERVALTIAGKEIARGKHVEIDPQPNALLKILRANKAKPLYALSNAIMTPATTKIAVIEYGNRLPKDREVWFSGKAMAIPFAMFAKILLRLEETGFTLHNEVGVAWNKLMKIHAYAEKNEAKMKPAMDAMSKALKKETAGSLYAKKAKELKAKEKKDVASTAKKMKAM